MTSYSDIQTFCDKLDSVKQHKKHRKTRLWPYISAFCISLVLGMSFFIPIVDDKTTVEHLQQLMQKNIAVGKTFEPLVEGEPFRYELIGNDTFSETPGLHKYVNETFYRSWLNKTIVWHLEKSVDGKTWQDCSYLLKVKKDWDTENKTEKHTPNFIADETAYYRIGLRTFKDASLKDVNTKDLTSVNMSFDVSRDDKYVIWYNWSDYVKSSEFSKTSYSSKTVTDVSNKKEYRFDITTGIKLNSGEYFEIDPEFGSEETFETGVVYSTEVCKLDDNKFVVVYVDHSDGDAGKARVGRVDPDDLSIAWGSISEFESDVMVSGTASYNPIDVCKLEDDKFVVVFSDDSAGDAGKACVGKVNDLNISGWGFASTIETGDFERSTVCQLDTDLFVTSFNDESNSDTGKSTVCRVVDDTISTVTTVDWEAADNGPFYTDSCRLTSIGDNPSKFIVSWKDEGLDGECVCGSFDNDTDTLSFGSVYEFSGSTDVYTTQVCRMNDTNFVVASHMASQKGDRVMAGSVSGNTITMGDSYVYYGHSYTTVHVIGLIPINNTQFCVVYQNLSSSNKGYFITCNVSWDDKSISCGYEGDTSTATKWHAAATGGGNDLGLDACNTTDWGEDANETNFVIVYQDDADSDRGKCYAGNLANWGYTEPVAEGQNWQELFSGYLTGGNATVEWQELLTGYLTGGNATVEWEELLTGWLTGGNIQEWEELFSGYLTGGNISRFDELFSGWLTGGNATVAWEELLTGYLTGGNASVEWEETFSGWLTGGNTSDWDNELFSGWLSGGNHTGVSPTSDLIIVKKPNSLAWNVIYFFIGIIAGLIIPVDIIRRKKKKTREKYE